MNHAAMGRSSLLLAVDQDADHLESNGSAACHNNQVCTEAYVASSIRFWLICFSNWIVQSGIILASVMLCFHATGRMYLSFPP